MRQRSIGRVFEDAVSIGIAGQLVRIDQSTHQLVVTVGGEAIVLVKISCDSLGIETIQAQNLVACLLISGNRVATRQR